MPHMLEASLEAQLEELNDRLHDCLDSRAGSEARAAQEILEALIIGYRAELAAIRRGGAQANARK